MRHPRLIHNASTESERNLSSALVNEFNTMEAASEHLLPATDEVHTGKR